MVQRSRFAILTSSPKKAKHTKTVRVVRAQRLFNMMCHRAVAENQDLIRRVFRRVVQQEPDELHSCIQLRCVAAGVHVTDTYDAGRKLGIFREFDVENLRRWCRAALWFCLMHLVLHRYHGLESQYGRLADADKFVDALNLYATPLVNEITRQMAECIPTACSMSRLVIAAMAYTYRNIRYYGGYLDMLDSIDRQQTRPWPPIIWLCRQELDVVRTALDKIYTQLSNNGGTTRCFRSDFWPDEMFHTSELGLTTQQLRILGSGRSTLAFRMAHLVRFFFRDEFYLHRPRTKFSCLHLSEEYLLQETPEETQY
ncbi:hypothetical protein AAP_02380 [Ascosphaera apis ARSEF 7405]|uniref:Uncharacterized protein n=1 Tax=Ascosphaera apis ARSEF 7405 TaxID=392613 RepID=A0A168A811_9EURO|nr:hypothetical protein AAP_02380 [Ascosphaera apis ARSEF 7405]